jgi:hypothetical protein
MAQADVTEGIQHAFVRKHAARQRELIADVFASVGHAGASSLFATGRTGGSQQIAIPCPCQGPVGAAAIEAPELLAVSKFGAAARNPIEAPCLRRWMAAGFIREPIASRV